MNKLLQISLAAMICGSVSGAGVKLVAHRGESGDAPENTVAAYELAWQRGAAWGVETDVHLTRDRVLVCCHDNNVRRTTGVNGEIKDMTLSEIKKLDAGSWKGGQFRDCRIPTLAEVLATLPDRGHIFVEIKQTGTGFREALESAINESGVRRDQISIISFSLEALREARKLLPENRFLYLVEVTEKDGKPSVSAEEVIAILAREKFTGVDIGMDANFDKLIFDAEYIKKIHDAGYEVHFWTVDAAEEAKALSERGADSLTTNRSKAIHDELEQ